MVVVFREYCLRSFERVDFPEHILPVTPIKSSDFILKKKIEGKIIK
jgi:hypothetical protein